MANVKEPKSSVTFRLDQELLERLQDLAESHDLPMAWFIRRAIIEYLERIKDDAKS